MEKPNEIFQSNSTNGLLSNLNRIFPIIISTVLVLIFYYYLLDFMEPTSFLPRLFKPAGATFLTTMGPVLTLFFFLWSVFDMIFIFSNINKNYKTLLINEETLIDKNLAKKDINSILHQWEGSNSTITFEKMSYLIGLIMTHKNVQSVYELFRYQTELESEKATSKYTLTKIAIWAMPILGFIGTVLGIGIAVGNFSGFLTQDIENIAVIKVELAKVTTGLSFAFDTTLLGLVLSMISMFISTYVQNFELKFLNKLEETGYTLIDNSKSDEDISPEEKLASEGVDSLLDDMNLLFDKKILELTKTIDALVLQFAKTSTSITAEFSRIPEMTLGLTSSVLKNMEDSMEKMSVEYTSLPQNIYKVSQSFTNTMSETSQGISKELEKIPVLLQGNLENYENTLSVVNSRLEEMKKGFSDLSLNSEKFYNYELAPVLSDVKTSLDSLGVILETLSKPTEIILTTVKK